MNILERVEFKASPPVEQVGDFAVSTDILTPECIKEIESLLRDKILYDESYKNHRGWEVVVHENGTSPLDQKASVGLKCFADYTSYLHYLVVHKRICESKINAALSEATRLDSAIRHRHAYYDEWGDEIDRSLLPGMMEEQSKIIDESKRDFDKIISLIEVECR